MRRHWSQHAWGILPDGSRVMLCVICCDNRPFKSFPAVLICRADGLYRLWRNDRSKLLAQDFVWPGKADSKKWDDEKTLKPHVPKSWGSQYGSSCVIRKIPHWLLRGKIFNARLLIAWYFAEDKSSWASCQRIGKPIRFDSVLPVAALWRPIAITVIPNTDVVVRAIHSGVLLHRLKFGMERMYISEMAWIRAPKIENTLRALANRFPQRLVLVKAKSYTQIQLMMKIESTRAAEYYFIGSQLQARYEDDFGYDKNESTAPLKGIFLLRIGDIPRGSSFLWLYQIVVYFENWNELDLQGINIIMKNEYEYRHKQEKRAVDMLTETLTNKS